MPVDKWIAQLTPTQHFVLRQKGTDAAYKGEYNELFDKGEYWCAGCGSLLYTSEMKFDCGCGWPGFWTNVPKSVREENDGKHIEILCNACNGHLGHIYRSDRYPAPTHERHCVNSTAIKFVPAQK